MQKNANKCHILPKHNLPPTLRTPLCRPFLIQKRQPKSHQFFHSIVASIFGTVCLQNGLQNGAQIYQTCLPTFILFSKLILIDVCPQMHAPDLANLVFRVCETLIFTKVDQIFDPPPQGVQRAPLWAQRGLQGVRRAPRDTNSIYSNSRSTAKRPLLV